jgi:hypothetical protein
MWGKESKGKGREIIFTHFHYTFVHFECAKV